MTYLKSPPQRQTVAVPEWVSRCHPTRHARFPALDRPFARLSQGGGPRTVRSLPSPRATTADIGARLGRWCRRVWRPRRAGHEAGESRAVNLEHRDVDSCASTRSARNRGSRTPELC